MPKEFKNYDKLYSKYKGTALANLRKAGIPCNPDNIALINAWNQEVVGLHYNTYTQELIQEASYHSPGADNWQKFRVSLKGLSTREKLYCLYRRWGLDISLGQSTFEEIRINNYLGALIRGGFLTTDLRVIK